MSESPWRTSAPPPPPAVHKPANWGLYLVLNIGLAIVLGLLDFALNAATGVSLPSLVMNLIVLVGSTWFAGAQWLRNSGGVWDRDDRKRLAFAYTMVNLVLTVIVIALIGAIVMSGAGDEMLTELGVTPEMLAAGVVFLAVVFAIATPLILWAFYGIMRLVLAHMVGGNARPTQTADTFN